LGDDLPGRASGRRRERNALTAAPGNRAADRGFDAQLWLAALLASAAVIVPLVFSIALEETFIVPKLVALGLVLVVGFVLVSMFGENATRPGWALPDVLVVGFGLLLVAGFLLSVDRSQSLWGERLQRQGFVPTIAYLLFYVLARLTIVDVRRLALLAKSAALGGALVALYAVLQKLGLDPIWSDLPNGRVFSTIGQPNALGSYLAATVPLTLVSAVRSSGRSRAVWYAATALQGAALVLSLSRGAMLALVAGGAVVLPEVVRAESLTWKRLVGAAAAMLGILLLGVAAFGPVRDVAERVVKRTVASVDVGVPGSVRMHLDMWRIGREITFDNPLLGTGPDTFALEFPAYRDEVLPPAQARAFAGLRVESPHNVYLAISSGLGLPALAVYLGVVAGVIRAFRPRPDMAPDNRVLTVGVVAAMVAHLVGDFFITAEVTGTWLFWLLLGSWKAAPGAPPSGSPTA
jgi:O-antigen ligase